MGNPNIIYFSFLFLILCQIYALRYAVVPLKGSLDIDPAPRLNASKSSPGKSIGSKDEPLLPNVSILPSRMKVHYHNMWNHRTSTIDVPEEYRNPFNLTVVDEEGNSRRALTSLEILQEVLHGSKYEAEFKAVEYYMENLNKTTAERPPVPKCLAPDLVATRELADQIVEARNKKKLQKKISDSKSSNNNIDWTIPFPVLNVGFPKVGSSSITDYFNCIGIKARHNQEGKKLFEELDEGKGIKLLKRVDRFGAEQAFTQLDLSTERGFYPQISLLDELHEEYPNSTMIFNFRPIADWIRSISHWKQMRVRFSRFFVPGLILTPKQFERNELMHRVGIENLSKEQQRRPKLTEIQIAKWWCGHVLHLREYVKEYPSHALIELDLYDTNGTVDLLYDLFRADTEDDALDATLSSPQRTRNSCWGKSNANSKVQKLIENEKNNE